MSYLGNRFELGVDHETVFADSDSARGEHDTRLRLGSALGLADGTLALGRPIREGFAIVTAHPSLDGRWVYVDPDADGKAVAYSDGLGPALVPDLRAYWRNDLPLEVEDLPPGYDLGSARLEVMPAYRGGRRLEVGSNAFITALGILADPSGAPLAYASGELISLDDPGFAPAVLFTNKTGRFAASGLKPGRYEIRLNTAPPRTATFSIPEESASLHQAGTILASDQQPL